MRLDTLFHAVKQAGVEEKKAFWKLCKTAASNDAGGVAVGLTKIAYDVWAGSYERGLDPAADQRSREAFASSFGSAYVAEGMATKLAEAGEISSDERDYLHSVIAESAVRDLEEMTKSADVQEGLEYGGEPPMNADQSPPPAPEGEAIGAEPDPMAGQTEGLDKAHKVVDNMIFLAQQVQLPQLAQELDQMRDQIAQHFADGHAYLPSELQHHFAQSEHAEAFMKKYKQRFGSPAVGGTKKLALFGFGSAPPKPKQPPAPPAWTVAQFEKHLQKTQPGIRLARSTYDPTILNYIEEHPQHGLLVGGYDASVLEDVAANPERFSANYDYGPDYVPYGVEKFKYKMARDGSEGAVERPKAAAAQDDWLSWRTRR